ncbi:MAG: type VI secretion system baseplate subunit TssG [Pseudomonadota bacterium]|nr:type VI secretion system baseplate subunit TssG [Pseudomonadota bacterium]
MPTPKRRPQTSLIGQLIDHPHRFSFFQAVRVIDLWLRRDAPAHGKTLDTVLRFKNSVALGFPASQIEALSVDAAATAPGDDAPQGALDPRKLRHIRITPAFMGFLGVNGVLPHDYTATIAAQIHFDKNEGGRAFFDSFSHRSMTLFYRAWAKCRIECRGDDESRDGFLDMQLALAGRQRRALAIESTTGPAAAPTAAAPAAGAVLPDEVVARYAALIRHRPLQGDMIAGMLADYFGVPFRFQPFVGAWVTIRPEDRTSLAGQHNVLGYGAMLGPRYWRRDAIARLWVGPLARADFDRFLAGGSAGKALKAMLALFAMPTVMFEVRLILRAADIKPATLDARSRLSHGAFLVTAPQTVDHDQTRYRISF